MRRLLESLCFMTAAGLCPAPVLAMPAELLQDACAQGPAYQPLDSPMPAGQTALVPDEPISVDLPAVEPVATGTDAAIHSEDVTTLMNLHHLMAHEMTHANRLPAAPEVFARRGTLSLLDAVTGLQQHFPARVRSLVYDTEDPPALGAWSVKWDAQPGTQVPAVHQPWLALPEGMLAPLRGALRAVHSVFETPSRRQTLATHAEASSGAAATSEPDGWAMLLAGVLGIGAMARTRLSA